jgi:hypothetical protein
MASNPSDENIIAHTQDYELNSLFANELPSIKATAKRLLAMTPEQRKAVLSGAGATAGDLSTAESSRLGRLTTERGQSITAGTAQQRLAFEQQKFAWEKANPGYELKEDENGGMVGVNKRTLQVVPVMVGGAAAPVAGAAAAVPAAAGGGRGSVGVSDGAAPALAGVGTQLMGKGTAMTETQSNAAMFGGAMNQAQKTIKDLEKSGTVKNAVVPGLLTGLAGMIPLGAGSGISDVITSTFNADPTGLIGPDSAQQKLAQAQLAFATAYLRKTSGASFGASEVSNTVKEFFPLIGEGDAVIAQKAAARERAIEGMKISTSKEGRKYIEKYGNENAPVGSNPNDPLNLGVR